MSILELEPIAENRVLTFFLEDNAGDGVASLVGTAVFEIHKYVSGGAGSWVVPTNTPVDIGGGFYELVLTQAECVRGPLQYRATLDGTIQPFRERVDVVAVTDCMRYFKAAGGGTNYITLDSAAVGTDDYYAGANKDAIVIIVDGTGKGQFGFANDYVGATKRLMVADNWVTQPDNTSIAKIFGGPGELDAATIAAIQSGLATASALSAVSAKLPAALVSGRIDASVGAYQSGQVPLQPTTAGRTLDVSAAGNAGLDWANIDAPTTSQNLSGTTVGTVTALAGAAYTAIKDAVLAGTVESGLTLAHAMQAIFSTTSGLVSGFVGNAPLFRNFANTKNRVTGATTTDARTAVAFDFD